MRGLNILMGPRHACFFFLFVAAWIYDTGASVVSLSLKADGYPIQFQVPHVAWPGVQGVLFSASGQHSVVLSAVLPDKIGSESARGLRITSINRTDVEGINPVGVFASHGESQVPFYAWDDWFVFPHNSFRVPFLYSPSLEEFHLGLGADSPVWRQFPRGATFCAHAQTLNFRPSRMRSCLGEKIASLQCSKEGALRCGAGELVATVGGGESADRGAVVSPFDQRIEFSDNTTDVELCSRFRGDYYYDRSLLSVRVAGGKTLLTMSGESVIAPKRATNDARLVSESVLCDLEQGYLSAGTINIGMLGSDLSFVYSPEKSTLEIFETKSNSMRNSWYDVIVINASLVLLVHWFFDEKKDVASRWTYVPEILGFVFSILGVWFQGYDDGAYYRVEDIDNAQTAVVISFWTFALFAVSHASSFLLAVELSFRGVRMNAVVNVRKFSYEAMLILSIFAQTLSGSMDVLDSYVSFLVGFSLVYNTSYRFSEMWFARDNHWSVVLISLASLISASYIFYVTTALPAMDPVASLSRFSHEAAVLSTLSAFLFAVVERSSHIRKHEKKTQ
tara:strand:+ start:2392 stop:4077 length:1686 start_codon:yes stop_codon:yes gene_type:complete